VIDVFIFGLSWPELSATTAQTQPMQSNLGCSFSHVRLSFDRGQNEPDPVASQ
jgi:hypothetical protein